MYVDHSSVSLHQSDKSTASWHCNRSSYFRCRALLIRSVTALTISNILLIEMHAASYFVTMIPHQIDSRSVERFP
jgi:hypothetical protein